ncbi:hypothetical protein [Kozakia baliensis]|uniref:hypothetical protein n=1 Tax=Kozakia baliensis TaxID=153496 RepID=UPI000495C40F|nr:hypothetical protein [Kozakia baliensis]
MRWLFILALACTVHSAKAGTENIQVEGQRWVAMPHHYRSLERVYRRFDSFPAKDRRDLALHMTGTLEPGDRPGASSGLVLRAKQGVIPLFPNGGMELTIPHSQALWDENPPMFGHLAKDENVRVGFYFTVAHADARRFTWEEAKGWLRELDACIEDEGGAVVAFLLPDTHKVTVSVSAHSNLTVTEGGQTRALVLNQGNEPVDYVFRPQDFSRDAVFDATAPLGPVTLRLPFSLSGKLHR